MRTLLIFALLAIACATVNCRALKDESDFRIAEKDVLSMLARDTDSKKPKKPKTNELKISFPLFKKGDDEQAYALFKKNDDPPAFALFKKDNNQYALFRRDNNQYALFKRGQNSKPAHEENNSLFKKSDVSSPLRDDKFIMFEENKRLIQEGPQQMSDIDWFKDREANKVQFAPFKRHQFAPFKKSMRDAEGVMQPPQYPNHG